MVLLSVIIPIYNEEKNIEPLFEELTTTLNTLKKPYEIIFVDDGSTDKTPEILKSLTALSNLPTTTILTHRKNFGQTAALNTGFENAKGRIIITMDGDGQNDPKDIPALADQIEKGADCCSGWRQVRHDTFSKKYLSRGARFLRKVILKDNIKDSGCSLKAYRADCIKSLKLFGETHRFIPAILSWEGYKVCEIPVNHRQRKSGKTKYNYKRLGKGLLDMAVVWFWYKFSDRPLYLFGGAGAVLTLTGFTIGAWMFVERVLFAIPLQNRVWPLVAIFCVLAGIQLFGLGILADIGLKTYFAKNGRRLVVSR